MSSRGDRDGDRRLQFGALLADALKRRKMRQDDLARHLNTTQSSVSGWINGKYEPSADTVFAIEEALDVEPGYLSRPLGYLPVAPGNGSIGIETAIADSDLLDRDEKAALLGMYHVLVERKVVRNVGEHEKAPNDASGRRPGRRTAGSARSSRPRSVAGGR